jgi:murein DD-endopeptidase MepM/ murein hydrolase activator NlpD
VSEATHRSTATATPHPTRVHRHRHHHHRKTPTPTPTPTVTPTPVLNLNTEDTISPVTCNGPGKPPAARPFLTPPFHGWTSIVSYFDHDSPNYLRDGLTIVANGDEARVDRVHVRTDFPAYWDADLRLYLDYDGHNGYDYDISYAPLYAAAPGKVIWASMEYPTLPHSGYGNLLMIEHRGGYVTLYGHLSKFLVRKGQHVKRGQQIGISGNTGHSTGPHVHFTVFHNCTPVDPYGWTGGGPDPLSTYKGESSEYLWKQQPLIDNTLPGWPGSNTLPAPTVTRIVLLHLPSTSGGTEAFTRALLSEAKHVMRALGGSRYARVDMVRGAVITDAPLVNDQVLKLSGVVSITTSDVVDGARGDLLAALARAARVSRHKAVNLTRSGSWTGYLMTYSGRTLLVGTGSKGSSVKVRLPQGKGPGVLRKIVADPSTGRYAIDLGSLTAGEQAAVKKALQRSAAVSSTATPAPTAVQKVSRQPVTVVRRTTSTTSHMGLGIALALLVLLAALAVALGANRRQVEAFVKARRGSRGGPSE